MNRIKSIAKFSAIAIIAYAAIFAIVFIFITMHMDDNDYKLLYIW